MLFSEQKKNKIRSLTFSSLLSSQGQKTGPEFPGQICFNLRIVALAVNAQQYSVFPFVNTEVARVLPPAVSVCSLDLKILP